MKNPVRYFPGRAPRCLAALAVCLLATTLSEADAADRPNVVVILADDLGYSDLGCYGGEIDTPHLDRLAAEGAWFSHYRTSPMCVTTRAALLSGMEYHMAGKQRMDRGIPLARLLKDGGYRTIISGKWHLAGDPTDEHMGFDDFFGFLGGQTNCFTAGEGWMKDGEPFNDVPADFYATDAFTDYAIEHVAEAVDAGEPFFLYLAYNAPHVPLQAPEASVRKYLDSGLYDDGYSAVRQRRIDRLIEKNLVGADNTFPPPTSDVLPWDLLPQSEKDYQVMKQAAYAGMIDRLDENVGRLLADLEARGVLDETMIVFASDNGASYVGIDSDRDAVPWDRTAEHAYRQYTTSNGWGYANNAPFRYYKQSGFEGGLASPLIVRWPGGVKVPAGTLLHQAVRVWDLYPTITQAAGVAYDPASGENLRPLMGEPLQPILADADAPGHDGFVSSFTISRAIIRGKWKATSLLTRPWELYDLEANRTETDDLAGSMPEKLAELTADWDAFVAEAGNVDPTWNPEPGEMVYWMHQRMLPGLASLSPKISEPAASPDANLTMNFTGDVVFTDANGADLTGRIRLMRYGQEDEVRSVDPTPAHLDGPRTLRFDATPPLEPGAMYYLLWGPDVVRWTGGNGTVNPLHVQRDGAYAWRFTVLDPSNDDSDLRH